VLSAEKTPTLWRTLPAFEYLIKRLENHQEKASLDGYNIIQAAIDKLEEYREEINDISAYSLALCKPLSLFVSSTNPWYSSQSISKALVV
jgi:hypothetical protein